MTAAGNLTVDTAADSVHRHRWTARDLAIRLFYRKNLFLACLILGSLSGCIAAALSRATFTADSSLIILVGSEFAAAPQSLSLVNQSISIDGLKAVQSEAQIIQADTTIADAIKVVGATRLYPALARRRWFGLRAPLPEPLQLGDAVERFHRDLHIDIQTGSNVIRISFSHPKRAIAIETVKALTAAYLARRRMIYVNNNSSALDQEIHRYSEHLSQLESEIQAVRTKFDVLDPAQDAVLATNRLDGIVQRQNQVSERRVAVETEIVAVRANLASQPAEVLDFRETTNNTGNDEARNTLVRLQQERTHLLTQFNSNWPAMQEIDRKIATVQAQISASGGSLYFSERKIRNPALDVLNNRLASLEVEDKALAQQLIELEQQSHVASDRIASLREADGQLHKLTLNREVAENIYRQLSLRAPGAALQDDAVVERNAAVRIAQAPTAPIQGRSLALTYVIGGMFFSVLLGLVAVTIATVLQRSYILSTDAERDLELHNLGDVEAALPGAAVAVDHAGFGLAASNLMQLSVDGKPLSMVQILSSSGVDSGDDVAQAIGRQFARRFALRTLILDLRRDDRPAAARPPASGVVPPTTAIPVAATPEEDLWVSVDAYRALFGERGRMPASAWQIVASLRDAFDMILVIPPPSLSDPLVHRLAGVVDATVLVLYAEITRIAIAERFREMVLDAGGNLAGFVFLGRRFYVPRWLYQRL